MYENFKQHIKNAVDEFRKWDKNETIRLISHLDSDGVSAASIMIKALNKDNRKYAVSIIQTLNDRIMNELKAEQYNSYIFTDLGSGCISKIEENLKDKNVLILDHHKPEGVETNVLHVNPHLFGIDGSREISGSGVVYFFVKYLNDVDMAHIAVVGAIGDVQERNGFLKLNQEILGDAIKSKKITVRKGLRFFGTETKPLHKLLQYCTDPIIPGISGSETAAIEFLQKIGIKPKKGILWRRLNDLTEREKKHLAAAIIMQRIDEKNPEDIFGNVYTLAEEEENTPFRDAKEFSTLLNACGRLGKASLGIGACLNNKKAKKKAIAHLSEYKKEIVNAINWYDENKGKGNVINEEGYVIINAETNVLPTIIGTLASIVSKSNELRKDSYVMSMAQDMDNTTKVSLRISGNSENVDLKLVMDSIVNLVGGEAGGHKHAAGAIISTDNEEKFVEVAKDILGKKAMEEFVS